MMMNNVNTCDSITEIVQIPRHVLGCNASIELGQEIGNGSFASVRLGYILRHTRPSPHRMVETASELPNVILKRPDTTSSCAVKCIDKHHHGQAISDVILRETKVLSKCTHSPYVASMLFTYETPHMYYIGLEFCEGGDLYHVMSSFGVTKSETVYFLREIACALSSIHELGVVYHDLKPENICLDHEGRVKLIDFGMATFMDNEPMNHQTQRRETISSSGTFEYCAPEVFWRLPHSFEVDWWSFGVVAYELLCGDLPYASQGSTEKQCEYICSSAPFHRNRIIAPGSPEESFVSMFLVKDQTCRFGYRNMSISSLLNHELLQNPIYAEA